LKLKCNQSNIKKRLKKFFKMQFYPFAIKKPPSFKERGGKIENL